MLLIDLQDVGSRYYTYVWTAALTLQVCAEVGVQVLLLDRPNPIGGAAIEGPGIAPGFSSFVGLYDVPVRHGMTCGELMRMVEREQRLSIDFEVIPMQGWRREQSFEDTGLPWVLPSPNMPTVDTAFVYPGGCLLEATNISEGRGTTRPFEIFGAPWIDAEALAGHINRSALPGVRARPLSFKPTFQKHAGEPCGGVQLHVLDRRAFRPFATGVAILGLIIAQYQQFAWREQPYEFVTDIPAIDLLAGGRWLRERQLAGDWRALADSWRDPEQRFAQRRAPFLLY